MGGDSQGIRFSLVGDSTEVLKQLADDIVPLLSRNEKLRDAWTPATRTPNCRCG